MCLVSVPPKQARLVHSTISTSTDTQSLSGRALLSAGCLGGGRSLRARHPTCRRNLTITQYGVLSTLEHDTIGWTTSACTTSRLPCHLETRLSPLSQTTPAHSKFLIAFPASHEDTSKTTIACPPRPKLDIIHQSSLVIARSPGAHRRSSKYAPHHAPLFRRKYIRLKGYHFGLPL